MRPLEFPDTFGNHVFHASDHHDESRAGAVGGAGLRARVGVVMAPAATPAPQPLLIGAAGHACVAWWHAPAAAADGRDAPALPRGWLADGPLPLAVVLASSWGEEDMAGYDGQRALAIELAEGGLGTLRFEWPDTGDSSAATGSTSVADALAAFDAAATQALALSGCRRLAFVGLRLGALLAARAALVRDDVDALVGLMPVASGQAFTRAQRELATGVPAPALAPDPGASFDPAELPVSLGGFAQSVRGLEALAALRWPAIRYPSLREALLVGAPGAVAQALAQAGVRVTGQAPEELSHAQQARLAHAAVAGIVRWLQDRAGNAASDARAERASGAADKRHAVFGLAEAGVATAQLEAATGTVLALAAAGARTWMRLQADGVAVRERVVRIGDARDREPPPLAGVLAEPDLPTGGLVGRPSRHGIVLLSAGGERRIGPHRLWVAWARRRAALGDVVLRLDLAGIGDSVAHAQPDPERRPTHYDARATSDIERALAWLRREHGVERIALVGLQSGAYQAWQAALAGHDVQQVVAINAPTLRWRPATAPAGTGVRALVRRVLRWPLAGETTADLARVGDRGVALDFVFSRREPGLALLRRQVGRRGLMLARDTGVNVYEIDQADPTFAGTAARAALYARLDSLLPRPSTTR